MVQLVAQPETEFTPYHEKQGPNKRERQWRAGTHTREGKVLAIDRPFLFWDGEGVRNRMGDRKPTSYALLGHSGGARIISESLRTEECLRFIARQGRENPGHIHVGFAFDYDVNMILRDLSPMEFRRLRDKGFVHAYGFRIEHVPHKWFQVTEYGTEKKDRITVRIQDIFGFFQQSFVKACKNYIPNHPLMAKLSQIEEGKDARNSFTFSMIDYIEEYWEIEGQLGQALVEQLREWLFDVDLKINRWHGPGALANYAYKRNGIAAHKTQSANAKHGDEAQIYRASRHAYAGGRFEAFVVGRVTGPVYGIDINSAYPYGISQLPSLTEGHWEYVAVPETIEEFGIYHIAFTFPAKSKRQQVHSVAPAPLFHRDKNGEITFPWRTNGWYWSPEAKIVNDLYVAHGAKIMEGWVYRGWKTRPFQFVSSMYSQRRAMKAKGIGSEKALKLCLNSLYGKMAQRTGWERTGKAPVWHQLEWAGWVTSNTRAMLYDVMSRIPRGQLIAVETDGIYTTCDPATLGISNSAALGGWEVTEYREILYLQSGTYFATNLDGTITAKYRGLDPQSLPYSKACEFIQQCGPHMEWGSLEGITTRFVGYRAALHREDNSRGPMKAHHCAWETDKKDVSVGRQGKRTHSPSNSCPACKAGRSAWDMPHELHISFRAYASDINSFPHDIPWHDSEIPQWRGVEEEWDDLFA
jgi:hypothetical protein